MSNAIIFNHFRFIENLTNNGFTKQQAEALAKEQSALLHSKFDPHQCIENLTKNDFTKQQAEALAEGYVTLINSGLLPSPT